MRRFLLYMRGYIQRPLVRPWALAGPVLVLMLCLPFLRPLRQPDTTEWSDEEQMTAATVQAMVEHRTLAIDQSIFHESQAIVQRDGHSFSPYSPILPLLLAPWYWVLVKQGMTYRSDPIFVQYLLTLMGATIPVAMCAGAIYRLARMFELRRSLRVGLGLASVAGGGLLTYAVAINRHAPAAMLLLVAVSLVSHLIVTGHPHRNAVMALIAGVFAALAACIDLPASIIAILLPLVFLAMRWSHSLRVGAVLLYVLGAALPISINMALIKAGGAPPAFVNSSMPSSKAMLSVPVPPVSLSVVERMAAEDGGEDADSEPGRIAVAWSHLASWIGRALEGLAGEHGVLSHYPILVVGLLGAIWVLHRNWTTATKTLAAVALAGGLIILVAYTLTAPRSMAYGAPWFLAASPLFMLWAGAWLKRGHRPQSWTMVAILLVFSTAVTLIGMSNPMPRRGYSGYSFGQATMHLIGHARASRD